MCGKVCVMAGSLLFYGCREHLGSLALLYSLGLKNRGEVEVDACYVVIVGLQGALHIPKIVHHCVETKHNQSTSCIDYVVYLRAL